MKKIIIILAIVAVIGFAVWYFVLNKPATSPATTTPVTPIVPPVPGTTIPTGTTTTVASPSSASTGSGSLDVSHDGEFVTVTPSPTAIIPDLSSLRSKEWSAFIYTGAIDRNDTQTFNYLTSFAPISDASALMGYNNDATFVAKACGSSPTDCISVSIDKVSFPFKITYAYGSSFASYLSSDLQTLYMVNNGNNIIKKVLQANGVVATQGESALVHSVPIITDLENTPFDMEMFGASTKRYGGDYSNLTENFNPLKGWQNNGVRILANNDPDTTAILCRSLFNGDVPACDKEPITKVDFPYQITYPGMDFMNPTWKTYISANQRTLYYGVYANNDPTGYFRVFKKYTF